MNTKNGVIGLLVILLILLGVLGWKKYQDKKIVQELPSYTEDLRLIQNKITIEDVTYTVDIADSDAERNQGLSGRVSMPLSTGMLFIFPDKYAYSFWMKDMHFALDFLWIHGDTIVDLHENIPAPQAGEDPQIIKPNQEVDKVLEINAGEIAKHRFTVGQKVVFN